MSQNFSENLVKGKITENIFQQMFVESDEFYVYPLGLEHTLPSISQDHHDPVVRKILSQIRLTPDFMITPKDKDGAYLVEVKYHHTLDLTMIIDNAIEIDEKWQYCWLFVATQEGFYFDSCWDIKEQKNIKRLDESRISNELQNKYHALLKDFLK